MSALNIKRLDSSAPNFFVELDALLAFEESVDANVESAAADIIAQVRARGDAALAELTLKFDRTAPRSPSTNGFRVPASEIAQALNGLDSAKREALEAAAARIREYHERQRAASWSYTDADGTQLGQQITPLDRVGLYVPGGKAAYPSSVLMNAIPAKVAGVQGIVMVSPTPGGETNPLVLAAAAIAGVDEIHTIGGAQAVAALAYGTANIAPVDKIVGPGNAYVAAAKRRVFGRVGIDMIAGPSEILVVADASANPEWVAMDLFSQAEHDEVAQAILLCPDAAMIEAVAAAATRLLDAMPRRDIIRASLTRRGALVQVRDLNEACELINRIAPEHLELAVADPDALLPQIRHAGAIFMGTWASESLGDYCAGPNHVLPTARTARFSSPLGVYDFQKRSSVIKVSRAGAMRLGPVASVLAHGEGLQAHARSAELRMEAP
jgi:histidinol dehydrogenase